jgi:pyruvate/2-oxoglutarate dehydrogenase complex dihydrolipoamide dehydrogenase (E3) component
LCCYACAAAAAAAAAALCSWEERGAPSHSWTTFLEAKRKELQRLNGAYKNTLKNANVELLEGFGRIVDAHTVDVSGKRYTVRDAGNEGSAWFWGDVVMWAAVMRKVVV